MTNKQDSIEAIRAALKVAIADSSASGLTRTWCSEALTNLEFLAESVKPTEPALSTTNELKPFLSEDQLYSIAEKHYTSDGWQTTYYYAALEELRDIYEADRAKTHETIQKLVDAGIHKEGFCDKYVPYEGGGCDFDDTQPCTCGWEEALAEALENGVTPSNNEEQGI